MTNGLRDASRRPQQRTCLRGVTGGLVLGVDADAEPDVRLRRHGSVEPIRGGESDRRDDRLGPRRHGRRAVGAVLPAAARGARRRRVIDHDVEVDLLRPGRVGHCGAW